jgi:nicotinate-nucleotide pyrophosphorylase (carboxylating)
MASDGKGGKTMLVTPQVRRLLSLAIEEDLGHGDVTTDLTVGPAIEGAAEVIARETLIVCGLELIPALFAELDWPVAVAVLTAEGADVSAGAVLARLSGKLNRILALERTILNFLQRMSGIATGARRIASSAEGITLLDTRKTTPGWRHLEKYAVRVGGAVNHRTSLADMVLVKNNHVDANGGSVAAALTKVFAGKAAYIPVEVEVRSLGELKEALGFPIDVVMLDNMNDAAIREALAEIRRSGRTVKVEVSGQIQGGRLRALAELGVKCVSMGALTTQARSVDISLAVRLV